MLALLAPGQGSQQPGVLAPWLDDPAAVAELHSWEQAVGSPLRHWGVSAGAEELVATTAAQLGVVSVGLAAGRALLRSVEPDLPLVVAGHSVGEWTAAALVDVFSPAEALRCVGVRAAAMSTGCRQHPGGMVAVLGGEPGAAAAAVAAAGLVAANHNGAGQLVAAGPDELIEAFLADPPAGVRLRRLRVEGAFHTAAMSPATAALSEALAPVTPADPSALLVSGLDGQPVRAGAEVARRLVAQVTAPVRFDLVLDALAGLPLTAVVELPPAGVLTGLVRRALPGVPVLGLATPADLARIPALAAAS